MRLQNLEIKGFKSFADKTLINFNQDIIGIVGPNGCGKSNIVDAMRWVLGEQKSRELRSEKMSNVIFNGTKKRKPGGRAEVSLTFNNNRGVLPTEYTTVTITRILYRTGESEYRLNGVNCRLKDITSLFLDTGIGSNSYAIIALGMVDDLLADRDNSRRRLFEQAAGISKYKIRKKETLGKLKGTEADLERVEDLLFEIEGSLKKLEKQAKRTKRFFELKAEYKTLSIELAVFQVAQHKNTYKRLETQINSEQDKLLKLQTQSAQKEAALEKEKAANIEKEKSLSQLQRSMNQTVGTIRNQENDKKVLAQKINYIQQNQQTIQRDILKTKDKIEQTELDLEYYRSEINAEKLVEETLENQLDNAEEKLQSIRNRHGNVKKELDDYIKNQQQLERQIFTLEKDRAITQSQIGNLQSDLQRNEVDIQRWQQELTKLNTQLTAQEKVQTEKQLQIEALERTEQQRQEQLKTTEELLDKNKEALSKINRQLDAKRHEYNLIKSMVDNLEGFPESIKFLSKNKRYQAPLLSDIFYCQPAYRVAIENYLDPYLSYYVVQNLAEALQAIQWLDKAQKGKANFFLLNTFETREIIDFPELTSLTPALSVVEMDESFKTLGSQLLGNVWIAEEVDFANLQMPKNIVVLAKSGKLIQRQFSITGGSVGAFEGKRIGRKKSLELLAKNIEQLKTTAKQLNQKVDALRKQLHQLKTNNRQRQIQREKDQLNRMRQQAVSVQTRLENFSTFLKEAEAKKIRAEERIQHLKQKIGQTENQLNTKKAEDNVLQRQISKMDNSFQSIANKLSRASQEYNSQNINFIKQQNKINTLQRELNFREKQIRDLTVRLSTNQRNLTKANNELVTVKENIQQIDAALLELYRNRKENKSYLTDAEERYYKSRGTIHEIEEAIRKINRDRQNVQQLIAQLKDKFNDIKLKLSSIGERLRIEFEVNINTIINNEPNPNYTQAGLSDKVKKLKKRLNTYGEINPLAIEAYEEMKKRYDFIVEQRDDLLNAKKTLLETIHEIESTATAHFLEAFNKVRANFKKVFRTLFTKNDDCDLLLADATKPLESRIKITAKPKGKRPQTINQLSGGEKTLTATALLFSLYLLKPAPFCIFDEVDAPLDDANISKFNRIIKEFSADSQFIIVTHNKQTMASVDVIYGVTMEEQGVSKVVPVDFRSLTVGVS